MDKDAALREHLIDLLDAGLAHQPLGEILRDLPPHLRGVVPEGLPYSAWQLLEHLRIAQWDILEFSRNPAHQSPDWPEGYWPREPAPPDDAAWAQSRAAVAGDLEEMKALVRDPKKELYAKIPHGDGQTLLREALLVADHNAYHLGQFVVLCRLLGAWD